MLGIFSILIGVVCFAQMLLANAQEPDRAQTQAQAQMQNSELANTLQLPKISSPAFGTQLQGELLLEASRYPSELPGQEKLNQSMLTYLNFNLAGQYQNGFHYGFQGAVGKYLDWGGSVFGVQQVFMSFQREASPIKFSVGRKIEFWSHVDRDWQLGLWEPKYNLDPLRPQEQGLTGFFLNLQNESHDLLLFATPLFVPTMGPDIQEKDGSLVADSRWYKTPSKSSPIMGKDTQLVYALNIPDLLNLVQKPGSGIRYRLGQPTQGLWLSLNLARKPINSLLLKYDKFLSVGNSTGKVTVSPDVGYHKIQGWDFGYSFENMRLSLSYLQDDPEQIRPEASTSAAWVVTQPGPLKIYGLHFESEYGLGFLQNKLGLEVDYLRVIEVLSIDVDSDGGNRGSLFPYRTQFTNALSLKTKIKGSLKGKSLSTELLMLRDFDQSGMLYGVELAFYPLQYLKILAGMDILSVDDPSEANVDARFLNQFRANDRFYTGVGYVF